MTTLTSNKHLTHTNMKKTFFFIALISIATLITNCSSKSLTEQKISPEELASWKTLDKGKSTVNGDEIIIEETEGADGYFLISPEAYEGDLIINYKVKALSESSVCIVLFSTSDSGETLSITMPKKDAKGVDFWNWRTTLEHYNFTFNNISHGNKPFFFKNISPLERGFYKNTSENVMKPQQWHDVEIGKKGTKLWFKLNGNIVFEQEDCKPLKGGHLIFRISGTNRGKTIFAKIAMKDLVILRQ